MERLRILSGIYYVNLLLVALYILAVVVYVLKINVKFNGRNSAILQDCQRPNYLSLRMLATDLVGFAKHCCF